MSPLARGTAKFRLLDSVDSIQYAIESVRIFIFKIMRFSRRRTYDAIFLK